MLAFGLKSKLTSDMLKGLENRAQNPDGIFRRWLGYFRHKARQRFDQLAGPPLAESTRKRYEQTRTASVTAAGNVRKSYAQNAEQALRRKHRDKATGQLTPKGQALIAELRRLAAGGDPGRSTIDESEKNSVNTLRRKLQKARDKAKTRRNSEKREPRKIDKHKLLGRLVGALETSKTLLAAVLRNRVPWSGVHNEGGPVGNRAQEPQRKTVEIDQDDANELAKIAVEQILGIGRKR